MTNINVLIKDCLDFNKCILITLNGLTTKMKVPIINPVINNVGFKI